jgi:hypothetical protein
MANADSGSNYCLIDTHSSSSGHSVPEGDLAVLDTDELRLLGSTPSVVPDPVHCTRDEVVLKLNSNTEWHLRRLILTKDKLMIANPGQNAVTDEIPLVSSNISEFLSVVTCHFVVRVRL